MTYFGASASLLGFVCTPCQSQRTEPKDPRTAVSPVSPETHKDGHHEEGVHKETRQHIRALKKLEAKSTNPKGKLHVSMI